MRAKHIMLIALALLSIIFTIASTYAYSGFPTPEYPGNQYGFESTYYNGPWGERMVYGAYGYFPNFYGYQPYGYRTYGYFYTPNDLRYGRTMRYQPPYGRGFYY